MWASRLSARSPPAVGLIIRFLFIGSRLCSTLLSDPRLATTPLRFAITSPPSGCEEDSHPQAVEHARHTEKADGFCAVRQRGKGEVAAGRLISAVLRPLGATAQGISTTRVSCG